MHLAFLLFQSISYCEFPEGGGLGQTIQMFSERHVPLFSFLKDPFTGWVHTALYFILEKDKQSVFQSFHLHTMYFKIQSFSSETLTQLIQLALALKLQKLRDRVPNLQDALLKVVWVRNNPGKRVCFMVEVSYKPEVVVSAQQLQLSLSICKTVCSIVHCGNY